MSNEDDLGKAPARRTLSRYERNSTWVSERIWLRILIIPIVLPLAAGMYQIKEKGDWLLGGCLVALTAALACGAWYFIASRERKRQAIEHARLARRSRR